MGRTIEMTWVCSSCQHRNRGRYKDCQGCGGPKDASEAFEMPADTRSAPSVVDPDLLRRAEAGSDWRCGYCGSDQSRLEPCCVRCGAVAPPKKLVRPEDPREPFAPAARPAPAVGAAPAVRPARAVSPTVISFAAGSIGLLCFVVASSGRPTDVVVSRKSWERVVTVTRHRQVEHVGFAETLPPDAIGVRSLGRAFHHNKQVFDHFETEYYTEPVRDGSRTEEYTERVQHGYETEYYTERVQDGYDTESHMERVRCGESCTTSREYCHEVCTGHDNGFASCHDVCTGGDEHCTPRYCYERRTTREPRYREVRRTRRVPRYRMETRTRQVPHYHDERRSRRVRRFRDVPVMAESFSYRQVEVIAPLVVRVTGTTEAPRWPSEAEIHPGPALLEGEHDETSRAERFVVTFWSEKSGEIEYEPSGEARFLELRVGGHHRMRPIDGRWTLVPPAD